MRFFYDFSKNFSELRFDGKLEFKKVHKILNYQPCNFVLSEYSKRSGFQYMRFFFRSGFHICGLVSDLVSNKCGFSCCQKFEAPEVHNALVFIKKGKKVFSFFTRRF